MPLEGYSEGEMSYHAYLLVDAGLAVCVAKIIAAESAIPEHLG